MTLEELGKKHWTQKVSHGYLPIYETLWKDLQNEPITLLEMGIYNGASLATWCDWFPNATIIGIDNNKDNPIKGSRAYAYIGDQADRTFIDGVAAIHGGFDIVIDDAGHYWAEQQKALEITWPHVKSGGMYIIEDLHTSEDYFWQKEGEENTVKFLKDVAEMVVLMPNSGVHSISFYSKMAVLIKPKE